MTPNQYLTELATRLAKPYAALPECRAILLTGSVAEGIADNYSDIDMCVYYNTIPSQEVMDKAMRSNGILEKKYVLGDPADGEYLDAYDVNGIEVQVPHCLVSSWEREMNAVLTAKEVVTPLQKAMSGVLDGIPLYGHEYIKQIKARVAEYPDVLRRAMVEAHLVPSPIWRAEERLMSRDSTLWRREMVVQAIQNMLGVLAGLNRVYWNTFQFRKTQRFASQLKLAPPDFYNRTEALLSTNERVGDEVEQLWKEIVNLVNRELPEVDTTPVSSSFGQRAKAWSLH